MPSPAPLSVIIPTLQRSAELREVAQLCGNHPQVLEVLIVNNAPQPLPWVQGKIRVLQQEGNIFVNPAWNLGVEQARGRLVAIVNDDVLFHPSVLDAVARWLNLPWVGMIGVDGAGMNMPGDTRLRLRPASYEDVRTGFGVFMALRRSDYVPIPTDGPRIWGGDDWLFQAQRRPNWVIRGGGFTTDMSATSGSPEFVALRRREIEATREMLAAWGEHRWWNKGAALLTRLRRLHGK
ncbi:glycosyltransferase family 2 protein [Micrococcus luteus]|uniref:glycosyltransferase family 2 protein n=1 Tax=Micrococcus luteus TaxID=1270 RepID=UPI000E0E2478|nr:glycosyltransferase [Micrococcus luteus]